MPKEEEEEGVKLFLSESGLRSSSWLPGLWGLDFREGKDRIS